VINVTFGEHVSPSDLLQARSPSLDLDSLYGAGPQDPDSAKFYAADGLHLKMGKTVAVGSDAAMDGFDLPRGAGTTAAQKRKAIIPDPRNDENLAVAQTHLAFIRFHNRVVDTLPASVPQSLRFATARELVTKHSYMPDTTERVVVNTPEEVEGFMREWLAQWRDFRLFVDECQEIGSDKVFVGGHQTATGRLSGIVVEDTVYSVWTFRGGKIVHLLFERDRQRALEAAGLSE
jgi:Animal haem peroxidase